MKKLLCVVLAGIFLTGCATSSKTSKNDDTTEITSSEVSSNSADVSQMDVTYSKDDFAFYTSPDKDGNSSVIIGLEQDEDKIAFNDENIVKYLSAMNYDVKDKVMKFAEDKVPTEHTVVNYVRYDGGNFPVVNVKGISTTGVYGEGNEYCSTAEDVLVAYDINRKQQEEYITNKQDDKNYVIQLYFRKTEVPLEQTEIVTDEKGQRVQQLVYKYNRIIVEKGKDLLNVPEANYSMKFIIRDGYVKGIDLYCYR